MEVISIVSGGPSASHVDLSKVPGFVIGVNNASLHAPRLDAAISMDRRWAEAYWPWMKARGDAGTLKVWLRPNNVLNIPERPEWLTVYKCDHKLFAMSEEPGTLNGTNSGGVALNLAYSFKPKSIFLFGFDYARGTKGQWHWFEKQSAADAVGNFTINERRYAGWAREFEVPGRQFRNAGIDVINVTDTTSVKAFRTISPREFMAQRA